MSLLLGLCTGLGLFLIWEACWSRPAGTTDRRQSHLELLLVHAGMEKVSRGGFAYATVTSAVLGGLLVLVLTGAPLIAATFALFGAMLPLTIIRWRARKRSADLREQWPDVVDHLRSAIRAGLSLPEALAQLGQLGPEALRPAFIEFARDYRATARFEESVERLRLRLADPVSDKIIAALLITREVGGSDLGEMLGTLSSFLRDSARTRGELEARQSWTVSAARLAIAAPWVILLLLASQPAAVRAYSSVVGSMVLLSGLCISVICYRAMLGIGTLPAEDRVIR